MDSLTGIIKQYWGYDRLMPLQAEAMGCVVEGRDSVVVLPTGGGKSLCFQAPAIALPGMAVVVSPLIALMKDQVDALEANGVAAACITSAMTTVERRTVHERVTRRELKLLYISPERMAQPDFVAYLAGAGVSFFAVDEAHCISQWGHDFRPEYRELYRVREAFPGMHIHAYTATATAQVRQDIVSELRLRDAMVLIGSFDRPNLVYRVEPRTDGFGQLREVIDRHEGYPGIVYCIRRADVDEVCGLLQAAGYKALPYHAGMDDGGRKRNQEAFARDETDIIVATVAFGMGIDKSNVRYVVHMGMPKSIEHYQQESGRAGRDGLESECCLFYSGADYGIWRGILSKSEDADHARIALSKLNKMYDVCTGRACRRRVLLGYFGEAYTKSNCGACDACLGTVDAEEESAEIAAKILETVGEIGDFAGPSYTALVLTGSKEERVLQKRHDRLKGYGSLAAFDQRRVREWIEELVAQGHLEKRGEYNVLHVTEAGPDGRAAMRLSKAAGGRARTTTKKPADAPVDQELFEALRKLRLEQARERNVPPFVIFSDATLRDMAARKPVSEAAFLTVQGVGKAKCEAFGAAFLAAIRDHLDAKGEAAVKEIPSAKSPKRSSGQAHANELFAQGHSIEDVAAMMGRALSTVEGYLVAYFEEHGLSDPSPWVGVDVLERVRAAAAANAEGERLKPMFEFLKGEVSYAELRVCLICIGNGG